MIIEIKRELKEVRRDETPLDRDIQKQFTQIEELKRNFSNALTLNRTRSHPTTHIVSSNTSAVDPWLLKNGIQCT